MSKSFDLSAAKVTKIEPLSSEDAKWAKIEKIYYKDAAGKDRDWEFASRKSRAPGKTVDAVGILAILSKPSGPEILLQKQFRPPVDGVCIEIPAGLVDANESVGAAAERELFEETGYVGVAQLGSNPMYSSPGFTNSCSVLVKVDIDLQDPRNADPKPHLEDGEYIENFSVPLSELKSRIDELARLGYKIDAKVQNIAVGLELAKTFGIK